MPRTKDTATSLENVITQMAEERQAHVDALTEIEALFDRYGIRMPSAGRRGRPRKAKRKTRGRRKAGKRAGRRGRPPGKKKKARGKRAPHGTMSDAIVDFVKKADKGGASSADLTSFLKKRDAGKNPFPTI